MGRFPVSFSPRFEAGDDMPARKPKPTEMAMRPTPKADLSNYLDQLFENFRQEMLTGFPSVFPISGARAFEPWFPALADLEDKGTAYEVRTNLPGLHKENIDIRMRGRTLHIDAKESGEKEQKGRNYLYQERSYQGFNRTIELPEDVMSEKISAKYQDGVLTLEIPKAHPETEKQIQVG
jgi:HSP20 family protein